MPVPDAHLEHPLAGLDVHPLDRLQTSGVKGGTERQVIDFGQLVVNAFDEVVLDGGDRQGTRRRVGARHHLVFALGFPIK